ncbi:MAG: hypothetical protein N2654_01120 [Deltaproteobacteria bacterium]|nr:hypothetical protein [Deltaproteobacteria bacterium]
MKPLRLLSALIKDNEIISRIQNTLQHVEPLRETIKKEKLNLKKYRKGENDYTTNVDLAVENYLCNLPFIKKDSVISEEKIKVFNRSKFTWLIDPIDGTINGLIKSLIPYYVLITLTVRNKPVFAVIDDPENQLTSIALPHKGVFRITKTTIKFFSKCAATSTDAGIINKNGALFHINSGTIRKIKARSFMQIIDEFRNGQIGWFYYVFTGNKFFYAHDLYPCWALSTALKLKFFINKISNNITFDRDGLCYAKGKLVKTILITENLKYIAVAEKALSNC